MVTDPYGGVPVAEAGAPPGGLVTEAGQLQYGRALLGGGSPAGWRELIGWRSLPEAAVSDSVRPQAHGGYPGDVFGGSLVVTFTYLVRGTPSAKLAALDTLETFLPMDGVDRPLVVDDGSGPWMRNARVIARDVPQDKHFRHGPVECGVQFLCADPRRYSLAEHTARLTLPVSSGGLQYPLAYPLEYGTFAVGSLGVVNAGSVVTPLVVTFTGPLAFPVLSAGDWRLAFDISLADGESLTVDTAEGTALLNGSADRLYTIATNSDPVERCVLKPGITNMALTAPSGSGSVAVTYRDARM